FRGLAKVKAQALLAAACQNMKKMACLLEQALRLFLRRKSGSPRHHKLSYGLHTDLLRYQRIFSPGTLPMSWASCLKMQQTLPS
ncbi:hypothetical protein, partial [Massilia niastensis]